MDRKITRVGWQPDLSTATTLEEFIAVLRRAEIDFDPASVTDPKVKIQYESIGADQLVIAEMLEQLLTKLGLLVR